MSESSSTGMEIMPAASTQYVQQAEARSLNFLNPKLWQAMTHAAQVFIQSGACPKGIQNAPQAIMVMQAGYEMGLQPVEALQSFCFINGKLSLYGEVAIALPVRQGHLVEWGECNEKTATVTITNKNTGKSMTNTFTMEMAKQRGLAGKEPYQKWPENMLKFKAFHMTAKFVCPEAFHGVPVKEELLEVEAEIVTKVPAKVIQTSDSKIAAKSLEDALNEPEPETPEKPLKASRMKAKVQEPEKEPETKQAAKSPATGGEERDDEKEILELADEKYAKLVDREINGEELTPKEKMWMGKHQANKKEQVV